MSTSSFICKVNIGFLFLIIAYGCNKGTGIIKENAKETVSERPPVTAPPVHGVYDYNLDEMPLINAGWTKIFEDDSTPISLSGMRGMAELLITITIIQGF